MGANLNRNLGRRKLGEIQTPVEGMKVVTESERPGDAKLAKLTGKHMI